MVTRPICKIFKICQVVAQSSLKYTYYPKMIAIQKLVIAKYHCIKKIEVKDEQHVITISIKIIKATSVIIVKCFTGDLAKEIHALI